MQSNEPVMRWVTQLPEVSAVFLRERSAGLDLMRAADELERQAWAKRAEANRVFETLEVRVREHFTDAEIKTAKERSGLDEDDLVARLVTGDFAAHAEATSEFSSDYSANNSAPSKKRSFDLGV